MNNQATSSTDNLSPLKQTIVGVQFLFVAFGATVLVPLLIGMNPATAIFTADICKPYFHMQHESFWRLVEKDEAVIGMAAEPMSWMKPKKERKDLPRGSYSVDAMRRAFAYAEIDGMLFQLLQNADARAMLCVVLINTYLTDQPTKTIPNLNSLIVALPLLVLVA